MKFINQNGEIATLEFVNDWYYLVIGDRVSQSRDKESRMRILSLNGYAEMK